MEIGNAQNSTNYSTLQPKKENQPRPEIKGVEQLVNKKVDIHELEKKISSVNQFLKSANTNLKFNLHEDLNEYYVTIVDEETKEVIKEVPPKKLLDMYAAMVETLGLFIDKKI